MILFLLLAFFGTDEITELRSQIQALKKENQQLKAQLELAVINGFYSPDAKTIVSPLQLLKSLPDGLKLQRKAIWDKFQIADLNEQLRQSNDMPFSKKLRISSLNVQENAKGIFETRVSFASDTFSYKGHKFAVEYVVKPNYPGRLHYKLDEPTVTTLNSFPTTKTLPVAATIDNIEFQKHLGQNQFRFTLKSIVIDGFHLDN